MFLGSGGVPDPEKAVLKPACSSQQIKDRVILTAISNDDPYSTPMSVVKHRPDALPVISHFRGRIKQHKAGSLPM
jgi:hypothetical protein